MDKIEFWIGFIVLGLWLRRFPVFPFFSYVVVAKDEKTSGRRFVLLDGIAKSRRQAHQSSGRAADRARLRRRFSQTIRAEIGESGPNPSPSGKPPLTRQSRTSEVNRWLAQRLAGGMLESKNRFFELMLKKHVVLILHQRLCWSSFFRYFPTSNR